MALGEHKAIPLEPARVLGVVAHLAKKQGHQDIGGRQRPSQMAGTGPVKHFHNIETDLPGRLPKKGSIGNLFRILEHQLNLNLI